MPTLKPYRSVKPQICAWKTRLSMNITRNAQSVLTTNLRVRTRKTSRNISNLYGLSSSIIATHRPHHLLHPPSPLSQSNLPHPRSRQLRSRHLTRVPSPYPSHPRLLSQPRSLPPRLHPMFLRRLRALLLNLRQVSQVRLLSRPCPLLSLQLLLPHQSR